MGIEKRSTILLVPILIAWGLDISLTLVFQPSAYWEGNYITAVENADFWRFLMLQHPLLLVGGSLAYISVCCHVVLALPPQIARYVATILTVSHAWAADSWLWKNFEWGGALGNWAILVPISICLAACLECSFRWQWDGVGGRMMRDSRQTSTDRHQPNAEPDYDSDTGMNISPTENSSHQRAAA